MSARECINKSICFHCGQPVEGPHVTWEGYLGESDNVVDIHLHTQCADFMAAGMKRDALELRVGMEAAEW